MGRPAARLLARLRDSRACFHTSSVIQEAAPQAVDNVYTRMTAGLPIIAGQTHTAGRGIFALRAISAGELIHTSSPVALHAPPGKIGESVCSHCLRNLAAGAGLAGFCSQACADAAKEGYAAVQDRLGSAYSTFRKSAEDQGLLFPLIAGRLACDVVAGKQPADILDWLCFARGSYDNPPAQWEEGFVQLKDGFEAQGISSDFFTRPWWFGVLSRIHINSFRVDVPRPLDREDLATLMESIDRGNGTAIYTLPSLYNHDCEPNADVSWADDNATMSVTARRDITPGEELRITYIDSMQTLEDRRHELQYGYGFTCVCTLCREEEAIEKAMAEKPAETTSATTPTV